MTTIFQASFPSADFSEFTNTYEAGNVELNNPAGRTTYCGEIYGYASGQAIFWKDVSARAAGTFLTAELYFKLDTNLDVAAEIGMFGMWNATNSAGISLVLDMDAVGGNRRLRLINTSGGGFYSSSRFPFSAYTQVVIYAYLHATAGKLRLEVGGSGEGEDAAIITLPNGSIDRFRWNMNWGSAVKYGKFRFDDINITDDAYPGWASSGDGTPLSRGIISPAFHDGRHCKGATGLINVS